MTVSPITAGLSDPMIRHAAEPAAGRDPSFADQLRAAGEEKLVDEARAAAEQLVSSAFIMPVLSQLRGSNLSAGPFAPGDAERRFGPVLDQNIADRLTEGSNFPLVGRLTEDLLRPVALRMETGGTLEATG